MCAIVHGGVCCSHHSSTSIGITTRLKRPVPTLRADPIASARKYAFARRTVSVMYTSWTCCVSDRTLRTAYGIRPETYRLGCALYTVKGFASVVEVESVIPPRGRGKVTPIGKRFAHQDSVKNREKMSHKTCLQNVFTTRIAFFLGGAGRGIDFDSNRAAFSKSRLGSITIDPRVACSKAWDPKKNVLVFVLSQKKKPLPVA